MVYNICNGYYLTDDGLNEISNCHQPLTLFSTTGKGVTSNIITLTQVEGLFAFGVNEVWLYFNGKYVVISSIY